MHPRRRPSEDERLPVEQPGHKRTRRIQSAELFVDAQEVQIEHAGETYRLRKTRAGKLILTK